MSGRCSANSIFNRWFVFEADTEQKVTMTKEEIKEFTDSLHMPCLYGGIHRFEEDVQQYTCKCINGDNCGCHKKYLTSIAEKFNPAQP